MARFSSLPTSHVIRAGTPKRSVASPVRISNPVKNSTGVIVHLLSRSSKRLVPSLDSNIIHRPFLLGIEPTLETRRHGVNAPTLFGSTPSNR
jgi:hypothetical protein